MELEVGAILTGKVTGITKFGAFVSLIPGKSGLVHISEIANTYVNNVSDHLSDGQEVRVKIIGIDENGRINLSIKQAMDPPARPAAPRQNNSARQQSSAPRQSASRPQNNSRPQPHGSPGVYGPSGDLSFEDKLKAFMQDSDSKISGIKQYADRKNSRRRNRG